MLYILGTNYIRVTTLIPDILYIADHICPTLIRRLSHVTRLSLLKTPCILNFFSRGDSDVKLNTLLYQTGLSAADPVSLMVTCASFASSLSVEIIYLQSAVRQHLFCIRCLSSLRFFLSLRRFFLLAFRARRLIPRIPSSINLLISAPISITYIHIYSHNAISITLARLPYIYVFIPTRLI